ncbi:high nitrogen upregulated cytochrome P450 monooxygenase 2 [Russula compacta]|nr:high nitrogen upregulated cytochrome P450 monooxygenase 2 [Russula compacta]
MSLATLTQYWPPQHTPQSLSKLDVGVVVLATSFVSHLIFRHFEPHSTLARVTLLIVAPALLSLPISYAVPWPYATLPLAFAAYGTGLIFFTLAYRLSPFHPLAKYPGPVLARSSSWWAAYITARGDLHTYSKHLHDCYGDVVRIGPNELSIRDASLVHPVLGQGGLPKGPRWEGRPGSPALIAQRDPVKHMHQRKPWNRAFSSAALKEYEIIVAKRTRQLVSCLENLVQGSDRKQGAILDMASWLSYFTTDFMGDMAFGGGFELMKAGGDKDGLWAIFESGLHISAIAAHITYIVPIISAFTGQNGALQRARTFGRASVLKRLEVGANRKDLFYYLSGEELPEAERPSVDVVAQDGGLAIIAGSDTTSSVLATVLYYLLLNPVAYERLQEEIDSAFPSGDEPLDALKLSHMEWLNGCINESLRLQPPVPSGSQRSVNKGKGPKVLGKLIIPEQTQVTLHTYSIHRDSRYFHTPDAFLPERWLINGAPAGEHNTAAFMPFSYGPAICAGKNLALMEMRMVLCWLLGRFRFSKAPGVDYAEWEKGIQDWFVVHKEPLLVNISLRE